MEKVEQLLRFLPNFWNKNEDSNNYKLMLSFSSDYNDIDDNIVLLKEGIQVNTATGVNLEDIGRLFNIYRYTGEDDVSLRGRIKSYFQASIGGGSKLSMQITIANTLGLTPEDVEINTLSPNIIDVIIINVTPGTPIRNIDILPDIINMSKAAGMYFNKGSGDSGFIVVPQNHIFMTNISTSNGEDTLL